MLPLQQSMVAVATFSIYCEAAVPSYVAMEASSIMSPLTIVDRSQSPAKKSRTKFQAKSAEAEISGPASTTTTTTRAYIIAATTTTTTTTTKTTTTATTTVEKMKTFIPIRIRLSVSNAHHAREEKTRKRKKQNEAYLQAANRWEIIKGTTSKETCTYFVRSVNQQHGTNVSAQTVCSHFDLGTSIVLPKKGGLKKA